jgi:hypothetical protein
MHSSSPHTCTHNSITVLHTTQADGLSRFTRSGSFRTLIGAHRLMTTTKAAVIKCDHIWHNYCVTIFQFLPVRAKLRSMPVRANLRLQHKACWKNPSILTHTSTCWKHARSTGHQSPPYFPTGQHQHFFCVSPGGPDSNRLATHSAIRQTRLPVPQSKASSSRYA